MPYLTVNDNKGNTGSVRLNNTGPIPTWYKDNGAKTLNHKAYKNPIIKKIKDPSLATNNVDYYVQPNSHDAIMSGKLLRYTKDGGQNYYIPVDVKKQLIIRQTGDRDFSYQFVGCKKNEYRIYLETDTYTLDTNTSFSSDDWGGLNHGDYYIRCKTSGSFVSDGTDSVKSVSFPSGTGPRGGEVDVIGGSENTSSYTIYKIDNYYTQGWSWSIENGSYFWYEKEEKHSKDEGGWDRFWHWVSRIITWSTWIPMYHDDYYRGGDADSVCLDTIREWSQGAAAFRNYIGVSYLDTNWNYRFVSDTDWNMRGDTSVAHSSLSGTTIKISDWKYLGTIYKYGVFTYNLEGLAGSSKI